jgi:hypothetical protein
MPKNRKIYPEILLLAVKVVSVEEKITEHGMFFRAFSKTDVIKCRWPKNHYMQIFVSKRECNLTEKGAFAFYMPHQNRQIRALSPSW